MPLNGGYFDGFAGPTREKGGKRRVELCNGENSYEHCVGVVQIERSEARPSNSLRPQMQALNYLCNQTEFVPGKL